MENETYTPEQLNGKMRKYHIKSLTSISVAVGGIGIMFSCFFNNLKLPEYNNAKETLKVLEYQYYNLKSQDFSYKNDELKSILGRDTTKTSKLEEAIKVVEADISKMEKTPEYIEYNLNQNNNSYRMYGAFAFSLLACFVGLITESRKNKLRKKLKEISK